MALITRLSADLIAAFLVAVLVVITGSFLSFGYMAAQSADREADDRKKTMLTGFLDAELDKEVSVLRGLAINDPLHAAVQHGDMAQVSAVCESDNDDQIDRSFGISRVADAPVFYCDFGRVGDPSAQSGIVSEFGLASPEVFGPLLDTQADADTTLSEFAYDTHMASYNDDVYLAVLATIAPEASRDGFAPDAVAFLYIILDLNRQYGDTLEQNFGFSDLVFSSEPGREVSTLALGGDPSDEAAVYANWQPNRAFRQQFWSALPFVAAISLALIAILALGVWRLRQLISEIARKEAQTRFLATHDSATGLANRRHFNERVSAAFNDSADQSFVFGFVDLDYFKSVNDTFGHDAGDALIVEAATRLRTELGETAIVGRLGGDEFAFMIDARETAETSLQRLVDAIAVPFAFHEHTITPSTSIGLARFPRDGATIETVTKSADLALYKAKERGRGRFEWFDKPLSNPT